MDVQHIGRSSLVSFQVQFLKDLIVLFFLCNFYKAAIILRCSNLLKQFLNIFHLPWLGSRCTPPRIKTAEL